MRRLVWITTAIAALAGAGMAVAYQVNSKSVKAVSATFTATTPSFVRTSTCTGADGAYSTTRATYTGTATSTEPGLNGPISISTEILLNTTTNLGTIAGKIRVGSGRRSDAVFNAVYSNGNIAGLAWGETRDPRGNLLANISAAFTTAGGFTNGKLGGATSGGDAVIVFRGGCKPTPAPKPDAITIRGAVTTVSPTSITAAGVTCGIPASLQAGVAGLGLVTGSQIEMTCAATGGVNTLSRISTPGKREVK